MNLVVIYCIDYVDPIRIRNEYEFSKISRERKKNIPNTYNMQ